MGEKIKPAVPKLGSNLSRSACCCKRYTLSALYFSINMSSSNGIYENKILESVFSIGASAVAVLGSDDGVCHVFLEFMQYIHYK